MAIVHDATVMSERMMRWHQWFLTTLFVFAHEGRVLRKNDIDFHGKFTFLSFCKTSIIIFLF